MTRLLADRRCCQYALTSRPFNSGESLTALVTTWFRNSGRSGVPQVLLVMTSSKSKDNIKSPAQTLRNRGVRIQSVGVGSAFDTEELKELSTQPYSDNVLGVTNYVLLDSVTPVLTKRLCRGNASCHSSVSDTTLYPDYTKGNVVRFFRWTFLGFIREIEFASSSFTRQLQTKLCTRQAICKFDAMLHCGFFRANMQCIEGSARKHATLPDSWHLLMRHTLRLK